MTVLRIDSEIEGRCTRMSGNEATVEKAQQVLHAEKRLEEFPRGPSNPRLASNSNWRGNGTLVYRSFGTPIRFYNNRPSIE